MVKITSNMTNITLYHWGWNAFE